MRCSRRTAFGLTGMLVLTLTASAEARECEGVSMPESVNVDGTKLVLNGMGVREATVFNVNVYVAGLYLLKRSSDAQKIAQADEIKQMRLAFVRSVSKSDMAEAIQKGFERAAGTEYPKLKARVERFTGALPAFKEGDRLSLTYRPGTGLDLNAGGAQTRIEGVDFARALFSIWLGANPPNAGLKRGLLGGACG